LAARFIPRTMMTDLGGKGSRFNLHGYGRTTKMVIEPSAWHSASNSTGEIKVATLESLQSKIRKLEQQAEALIAKQSSTIIEKIRELMSTHGLTIADVDAHGGGKQRAKKSAGKSDKPAKSAAKYRDAKTGVTWSGHGRAPAWIATAKNRDEFLVDGSAVAANVASASKTKAAGNYVRGPQPAMYRHPKLGATWSGRGRAPAWIAGAKDRNKFLISEVVEANVATTEPASKAKTVSKKTLRVVNATTGKGQPKGFQPAKYLDTKTGATWSGRGRAPAWIAGARDRSKFLIDAPAAVSAAPAWTSEPKVAARKSAAKKVVAKNTFTKKIATHDATAAKKAVSSKKSARQKVVTTGKKVAAKESPTLQAKKPVARKLVAKKPPAVDAVSTSAAVTAVPEAAAELNA
jgi:DNA-binding protein H-NS